MLHLCTRALGHRGTPGSAALMRLFLAEHIFKYARLHLRAAASLPRAL